MFGRGEIPYHLTYIDDLVRGMIICVEEQAASDIGLLSERSAIAKDGGEEPGAAWGFMPAMSERRLGGWSRPF